MSRRTRQNAPLYATDAGTAYASKNLALGSAAAQVAKVGCVGWYDAGTLSVLADGTAVSMLQDQSGSGHHLRQLTSAAKPTKQTVSGKTVVRFVASTQLANDVALAGWPHVAGAAAPVTIISVVKPGTTQSGTPLIAGGLGPGKIRQSLDGTKGTVIALGGTSNSGTNGPSAMDGGWHIATATVEPTGGHTSLDGYVTSTSISSLGTDSLKGITLGAADPAGALQYLGDVGEVLIFARRLTLRDQDTIVAYLAAKWGITVGTSEAIAAWETTTSSNGQAVRIYTPPAPPASKTLILWSHPAAHTEQVGPGYWAYAYAHAAMVNGWHFAASNMHADSWGNATALADLLDLYNLMAGRDTFARVILAGASMGGLATANATIKSTIPNTVGAYVIDGAVSLSTMFAGNAGTYSASIRTAYGIAADGSDYASKTATYDPCTVTGSSIPVRRWRFVASTTDATVVQTSHTDVFQPIAAVTGTESAKVQHLGGHLDGGSANPADFVAFVKRCGG